MSEVQLKRQKHQHNEMFTIDALLMTCLQFLAGDLSQWTDLMLVSKKWKATCHCPTIIRIIHVRCKSKDYTDNFCQALPKQLGLCHLDLAGSSAITDVGMRALSTLTSLQTLNLRRTKITDIGMQGIANLTALRLLDISQNNISDEGLHALKGLTLLNSLNLRHTAVTNSGLSDISNLTSLRELDVRHTAVTEQEMKKTLELTSLTSFLCEPLPKVSSYWDGIEDCYSGSSDDEKSTDDETS
jgi:hypothetical protein